MNYNAEYPINFVLINYNKVRLTAFAVFILAVLYIITGWWTIAAFLVLDFGTRAGKLGKFSLLNGISNIIIDFGGAEAIPVNEAPKIFSARIGFIMSLFILAASLAGFSLYAQVLSGILAFFSFLESILRFCVGCYIYSRYIHKISK